MLVFATRLTAQHDASVTTALTELEAAEEQTAATKQALLVHHEAVLSVLQTELDVVEASGHYCIRTLEDELGRTRQAHAAQVTEMSAAHAAEVSALHGRLLDAEGSLQREKNARRIETRMLRVEMQGRGREVEGEVQGEVELFESLLRSQNAHMAGEVDTLEGLRGDQARRAQVEQMAMCADVAADEARSAELREMLSLALGRLEATGEPLRNLEPRGFNALRETFKIAESSLQKKLTDLRTKTDRERAELKAEINVLQGQVKVLRDRLTTLKGGTGAK